MSPNMNDLLSDEVRKLPTSPIPIEAVIGDGRRRLWRHRAAGGAASFAAVAALALVAPAVVDGSGSDGDGDPAVVAVDRRAATYSTGSTIHSGDQKIDVSPHEVWSFVQTDDGFVFCTGSGEVYLADGSTVEQIGDGNALGTLAADDSGSYVGWVDYGTIPDPAEYVFYDTSTRTEVLRGVDEEGEPSGGGEHTTDVVDIDGDIAYLRDSKGFVALSLTDGTSEQIASGVDPQWLWGVSDGQIAHIQGNGEHRYVVVNDDPQADQPRVPMGWEPLGAKLSPSGKYVVTLAPQIGNLVVSEMPSGRDVTPDDGRYAADLAPLQWVGDDSFYAVGTPSGGQLADVVRCTISTGQCSVVAAAVAPAMEIQGPNGENSPIE